MKSPEYYGRPRREMQPHIPATATRLLDIGCGAGAFAAGLRAAREQDGRKMEIWGVEMSPEAARLATEVMDRVLTGDFHHVEPELPRGHFDTVLLNDVLEHVIHPEEVLRRVRPLLAPGGVVVASIPNVRHFFNVVNLVVHGRWDYTEEGILDRTHLRFFTRSSMKRMFLENGYRVDRMVGINPTGSLKFKFVNVLTLGRWADMRFLQFAVTAAPRD